jgi:hypothetical protein
MKKISKSKEDEMIALFLKEESNSKRFSESLDIILNDMNVDKNIISNYNINNNEENIIRKKVLSKYRGYENDINLFKNFPKDIDWYWVELNKEEIENIKYIDYDYWIELTNGSRYAKDSKENILTGKEIFGVSNQPFIDGYKYLKEGNEFDPIILLASKEDNSKMIVLEGHSRLTSINLALEVIDKIICLVGFTKEEQLMKWNKY